MLWSVVGLRRQFVRPGQPHGSRRHRTRLELNNLESRITPDATLIATNFFDGELLSLNASTGELNTKLVSTVDGLQGPSGMTKGPDGALYLSSQFNDKIMRYDLSTDTLTTFIDSADLTPIGVGLGGSSFSPAGLAFGPDGDLYVSLNGGFGSGIGAVVRFDVSGGVYAGTNTTFATNLNGPTGIIFGSAAGDTNSIYVSNTGTAEVLKVPNATTATSLTDADAFIATDANSNLNFPSGLRWQADGDLIVVDLGATSNTGQILEFNPDGSFDKQFTPTLPVNLLFPSSIEFDDQGRVYSANLGPANPPNLAGSINLYDADGAPLGTFFASADFPGPNPFTGFTGFAPSQLVYIANQAPTLTLPTAPATFTEDTAAAIIDAGATVVDADNSSFDGGTLTVSITANGTGADVLAVRNQGSGAGQIGVTGTDVSFEGTVIGTLSGGVGGADLEIALNADATPTAVQALLRNLTFSVDSNDPSTALRSLSITLDDGDGGVSNSAGTTVSVVASNDAPSVTVNTGLTVAEGSSKVINVSELLATDVDGGIALTYTVTVAPLHGTIQIGGVPVTSFTQTQLASGAVSYVNNGDEASTDTFTVVPSDGIDSGALAVVNVTVTPVNDAPVIVTNTGSTVLEGSTVVLQATELLAVDPDSGPGITYAVTSTPTHGFLALAGSPATTFTQSDVAGGLVSYFNNGDEDTTDSFTFTLTDGTDTSVSYTFNLTITPVNDAPTVGTNTALDALSAGSTVIPAANLAAIDPDNLAADLVYTVTVVPGHGSVQIGGLDVTTFTQADLNAGLVSYLNNGDVATSDSFTFTVSDGAASTDSTVFAINVIKKPVVTQSPASQVRFLGEYVTFTADATGFPAPFVQWQVSTDGGVNFTNLLGANSKTLSVTQSADLNGNQYRAVFVNLGGIATTTAATLTVKTGLSVLASATNQSVPVGTAATFTAISTGSTKTTVQWQVSTDGGTTFSAIKGATKTTYTVKSTTPSLDGNLYRAVFKNASGTATSAPATLDVNLTVTLTTKKVTLNFIDGSPVTLVAQANGKVVPTGFQWEVSTDKGKTYTSIAGETSDTVLLGLSTADNGKYFRATYSVNGKAMKTGPLVVNVGTLPVVTTSPTSQSVTAGTNMALTAATSTAGAKVQWQVSVDGGLTFTDVGGGTKTTLKLNKIKTTQAGIYRAVFSTAFGSSQTSTATVVVA